MSFETAKKFLDMILDADEMTNSYITSTASKGCIIDFIGGEPWLEIDLITKVSDYFIGELFRRKHPWATRFMFSFSSNGLLHFDPRVQKYLKKHIEHLSYSVSIDGNKELHDSCRIDLAGNGTYDRAIAAVYDYRDNLKRIIGSKMTIAPGNVDKVFSAVTHMIQESEYKNINLNYVFEEGWTKEHANILYWELHKITDWLIENNLLNDVNLSIFDIKCGQF
jgi:radical SAM peptide maturase (CXXX-repeat target family)